MIDLLNKLEGNVQVVGEPKGIYDDGCVGKKIELSVICQEAIGSIQVIGYIPPNIAQGNHFTLEVGWQKKEVFFDAPEFFKIPLMIRALAKEEISLKLEAKEVKSPKQAGVNEDEREIGFLLNKLVFSPENEVDYIKCGNQLMREGKLEEAIIAYRYASQLDSELCWSYYYLGKALSKQGKHDEAADYYNIAVESFANISKLLK